MSNRRTKRRYAHELYPHADEGETRTLAAEVPYLYSRTVGMEVFGTSWFAMRDQGGDAVKAAGSRTIVLIESQRLALIGDALLQGMAGDAAWAWADHRSWGINMGGEITWERAVHYGVPVDQIKPYPCGPEPGRHDHHDAPDAHGWRTGHRIDGKESECLECTEEIPEAVTV